MCELVKYISPVAPGKNRENIDTGSGPEFSKPANCISPVAPGKNMAKIIKVLDKNFPLSSRYIFLPSFPIFLTHILQSSCPIFCCLPVQYSLALLSNILLSSCKIFCYSPAKHMCMSDEGHLNMVKSLF
jgi:hypothetical protein